MDCDAVRDRPSAYYDEQLAALERSVVAEHIRGCSNCAREFSLFQGMTRLVEETPVPEPPPSLWERLESELDSPVAVTGAAVSSPVRRWAFRSVAALAAALLVVAAVGWLLHPKWEAAREEGRMAATFSRYLEALEKDPQQAQGLLLAEYEGRAIAPAEVDGDEKLHPRILQGLPHSYAVDATYVLDMPCCKCVQCVCKRPDGQSRAVFEHRDDPSVWFGSRPVVATRCGGIDCQIVQVGERLAASWKEGDRYVTLVGFRDLEELPQWMAWWHEARNDG